MRLRSNRALTLVESLVSIALLGIFISGFLGVFIISRLSTLRAQHRIVAMNIIRQCMEREVQGGFSGGQDKGDYYVTTVTPADPAANTPTASITVDNVVYTLTPDPYYPNNIDDPVSHTILTYQNTNYKIVGFVVTWTERIFGSGAGPTCSERAATYLFHHGS